MTDKNQPDIEHLPHERTVTVFGYLILGIAVALSVFQIWQGISSTISATYFRPIHLCWVLILIFLHYPLITNRKSSFYLVGRVIDLALCGLMVRNFNPNHQDKIPYFFLPESSTYYFLMTYLYTKMLLLYGFHQIREF